MKKVSLIILFILVFSLSYSNNISYKIPKVLVIQSYHSGYLWTDNINNGIKATLKKYDSNVRIRIEFLDTKRFTSEDFKANVKMMLQYKYLDSNFDVVIVADNNAFEIVKELRDTIFKDTPIVFCGLNFFEPSQLGTMTNVTGVREKIVFLENFKLIKSIHKDVEKIIVINDMTPTGRQNKINVMSDIRDFKEDVEIEIVENISIFDLKEKLRNLSPNTIVLYSLFLKDNQGRFLEYDESILLVTESSSAPVYITTDFSFGYGSIGGFLTSGTLQGVNAAELTIRILNGEKADKLAIIDNNSNSYYFDYKAMQKWGIKLSDLPPDSEIINLEESYWDTHKKIIIRFSLLILLLSGIIFWLIITLLKKNSLKNDLLTSNESLTDLKKNLEIIVKERTNDLEDERNFIRTVQNNQDSLVIVFDKNGIIERANSSAILNLEFKDNSVLGDNLWHIFEQEEDLAKLKTFINNNEKDNSNLTIQLKLISNNGKKLVVDSVITSITTRGLKYFILTGTNVTEKYHLFKKLESEEKKYRSVYENSGIAMITIAANNLVTMANKKFEELSGYSKDEIINKMSWQSFVDASDLQNIIESRKLRYENKLPAADSYDAKFVNKKGFIIDAILNVVMVPETQEIISSITDITSKKAVQNKMKFLLEEYKAFNEIKNKFYDNFTQDLSTPLNSIQGMLDLIKYSKNQADIEIYISILHDLSGQMSYIIQEMNHYQLDSSIDDLVVHKSSLSEFFTYSLGILIERSNISQIFFAIDEHLADSQYLVIDKLEKIIQILLIKLAKNDLNTPVIIEVAKDGDDNLKFTLQKALNLPLDSRYIEVQGVKNRSLHNLEYINDFRCNYFIVNKLVNFLGGKIDYQSGTYPDKKFIFTIKIFTIADINPDLVELAEDSGIEKYILPNDVNDYTVKSIANLFPLKILIVNYDEVSRFVLYKILEILNQKIDICSSEQELIELMNKTTYDVIFFDFTTISINNLETLQEIRQMENIYQPYIIANGCVKEGDRDFTELINNRMPDVLTISNIAILMEEATEFKNRKI